LRWRFGASRDGSIAVATTRKNSSGRAPHSAHRR
jgi:hypothetical protein